MRQTWFRITVILQGQGLVCRPIMENRGFLIKRLIILGMSLVTVLDVLILYNIPYQSEWHYNGMSKWHVHAVMNCHVHAMYMLNGQYIVNSSVHAI